MTDDAVQARYEAGRIVGDLVHSLANALLAAEARGREAAEREIAHRSGTMDSYTIDEIIEERERLRQRVAELERLLDGRDSFIVSRCLWTDFVAQLPANSSTPSWQRVAEDHPWSAFLSARAACIDFFHREGKFDDQIARVLSMDGPRQVYLIRMRNRTPPAVEG